MRTTIKYRTKRRRKPIRRDVKKLLVYFVMILLVTVIPVIILNLKPISQKDIDITFDSTKNIEIPYGYLDRAHKACKEQELSFSEILTFSSYITGFNYKAYNHDTLKKAISLMKHEIMTENQKTTHSIYSKVFDDLKVGPIPQKKEVYEWNDKENKWDIKKTYDYRYTSQNDFGQARTYGGNRTHDGNDLIADMGTPIVSMTDGTVSRLGWNEYGGQRVGITSERGTYFYYAHMDKYRKGLKKGMDIHAGDVIGYVGDTGYGPPGTRGKIIPHLHVQIGYREGNTGEYTWFNPYDIIKFLDNYRVVLIDKNK